MSMLLEVSGVSVTFDGFRAINNLSINFAKTELRAIIGPNGAGKSSMLNVISGFYNPQEGEVWYQGQLRPPMKPYQVARQGIALRRQIRDFQARRIGHLNISTRCL